jgi:hypothetical protein|tara:strand:+ start:171 stop:359 length:189 start_codon:yes stop_codon:yes gene_type:complete
MGFIGHFDDDMPSPRSDSMNKGHEETLYTIDEVLGLVNHLFICNAGRDYLEIVLTRLKKIKG